MKTECQNCSDVRDESEIVPLEAVRDLLARIQPGELVPAGECRSCGALVHLIQPSSLKDVFVVMETINHEYDLAGVFTDLVLAKAFKEIDPTKRSVQHWEMNKEGTYVAQNQAF